MNRGYTAILNKEERPWFERMIVAGGHATAAGCIRQALRRYGDHLALGKIPLHLFSDTPTTRGRRRR